MDLSLSETVSAALSVKLCLADDADFQWDYPQVSECGGNSEDEHTSRSNSTNNSEFAITAITVTQRTSYYSNSGGITH